MVAKGLLWAVYLLPCAVSVGEDDYFCEDNAQTALLANLTATFDPHVRPHRRSGPEQVEIQIYLTSVTEIDQKGQQLGVAGYLRQWWTDPRLAFKSTSEGGCLGSLLLSDEEMAKVWQPDIYFDNSVEEIYGADLFQVGASGNVWKSERINHLFECKMDFRRLPFDTQRCTILVASYSEDASEVRIAAKGGVGVILPESRPDTTMWDIDEVRSFTEIREFNSPWSFLNLEVVLKRRPEYYIRGIALKALLFVVISWCGFFVNRNVAPARVAMGTIPVLIMINLLNSVDAFLPPISYSTALTDYLMTCLIFTSLVVFEYAFVAYLLQIEARNAEKNQILMKLGTSYLKKQEPQRGVSSMSAGEEQSQAPAPEQQETTSEKTQEHAPPTGSTNLASRLFMSAYSNNSSKKTPSNIFEQHPVITELFREFDRNGNGRYSVAEFRKALRGFGQYRSHREVREMFAKLGVVAGEDMTLDQFEVFLANPSEFLPVATTRRSLWDIPPSLQLDIFMRFAFPATFGLMFAIHYSSAVI